MSDTHGLSFQTELTAYLDRLRDLRERSASEDSIRDAFLGFLRGAFPRIERAEPILLERHVPALRVRGGFVDALYGDIIFEFKRRLDDASRADGTGELARYVANQQNPERYIGILSDGEHLEVYALRGDALEKIDQLLLEKEAADGIRIWLDCYLFHEKHLTPTADDVALRFGERSPSFWRTIRVLENLWSRIRREPASQTKLAEWGSLLAIVYGSPIGDEPLFLRHTYLALFSRLLAFAALERRSPTARELPGILSGMAFEEMGFRNFVGEDFFSWGTHPSCAGEVQQALLALATRLTASYDLGGIREDLLKQLYQELVDPQTRHDLGEYYTPDWLAEMTLREAGFPPTDGAAPPSILDPACGSGTFLFTAIRVLRESGVKGRALVRFAESDMAGLDVHPLAVTISKTNLLLALGSDVGRRGESFSLPIYMADALSAVKANSDPDREAISVLVDVKKIASVANKTMQRLPSLTFELPVALAARPELLEELLASLLELSDPGVAEPLAREGLRHRLDRAQVPRAQYDFWNRNLSLMRWLLSPPATNSVWRFILRNAYQPQLLAERGFDLIVGNPPWLAYRYIKRADYQERVRRLMFHYQLARKKEAHLFTQIELATLFFAFCADRFLNVAGRLAFVMPRSILTGAKQHREFARRYLYQSERVIDCERVEPLFNVPTCAVVWRKRSNTIHDGTAASPSYQIVYLEGKLPRKNASLAEANERLSRESKSPLVSPAGRKSPYLPGIVQGASLVPRSLWFVATPATARAIDRRRPQLQTDPAVERQAKLPWKRVQLSGSVETEYLFATLLSDHMLPFGSRRLSLVALPLGQAPTGRFVADTTTYRLEMKAADEAHFLCAMLNAPIVDQTIKPFQPKGLFGSTRGGGQRHIHRRPFEVVPIPRFDKSDKNHLALARLSRRCHETVRRFVQSAEPKLLSSPIGRLRTHLRKNVTADEIGEIDEIVRRVLAADAMSPVPG